MIRDCEGGGETLPAQPANFVDLHTSPSEAAPLVDEPFLPGPGTTCANDWGDKAVTGQMFAVAERQGDWLAICDGGQKAWLHDSNGTNTAPGRGTLVTPKAGLGSIPVYGRAYRSTVVTSSERFYQITFNHRSRSSARPTSTSSDSSRGRRRRGGRLLPPHSVVRRSSTRA